MTDITQEKRKLLRLAHKVPVEFRVLDNQQVLIPGVDQQRGQTLIIVTHDPTIGDLCDRIVQMQDGMIVSTDELEMVVG